MLSAQEFDIVIGLDVGKGAHHAVALDRAGAKVLDKPLPNDEAALRDIFAELEASGRLLLVVDLAASIGALPVAVAHACGVSIAYLPGLSMRRFADLHPGESKTDARDAFIIAHSARVMPGALRLVELEEENVAELSALCGFDDDMVEQNTATRNRLRGTLTHIHPALERFLGPKLSQVAILDFLADYPSPAAIRRLGLSRTITRLRKNAPRMARVWGEELHQTLAEQSVSVAGTEGAALVISSLAKLLLELAQAKKTIQTRIAELVASHRLHPLLSSMPAVGIKTEARILTEIVGREFPTAGHLASYAGLAPVVWRSGTSVNSIRAPKRGNKILKRLLYLSAFSALKDPVSRAYYDRKRSEGKRHSHALIAPARRRCDTLYAMLRDGTLYEVRPVGQLGSEVAGIAMS